MNSEPATRHQSPATHSDEVLVRVEGVSKKFCRSLKKSLWYGVCDIAGELSPFGRRDIAGDRSLEIVDRGQAEPAGDRRLEMGDRGQAGPAGDRSSEMGDRAPSSISHLPSSGAESAQSSISHLPSTSPPLRDGEFWAVNDVSFELRRGECLGLIGHNGAGKTTLLKMLNGLIKPDAGHITMRGRIGALIALGAGFNPILTGRENIYINGSVLGLSKKEIDGKIDEIIDFAEIGDFIDSPVQNYSSGMNVRLGFSVASCLTPQVLLVDEVLAVGDYRFRWKCLDRIKQLKDTGTAIILVSHQSSDLMRTCERGILFSRGRVEFVGKLSEALHHYEILRPKDNENEAAPSLCGPKIRQVSLEKADNGDVLVAVNIESPAVYDRFRLVFALTHSTCGHLFALSSFRDLSWLRLDRGVSEIKIKLSGFKLQAGICRCDVTLRGEGLADIYDRASSSNDLRITQPEPNYEGFGTNGIIVPEAQWEVLGGSSPKK
jgi:lipopolysaccharide transport system ATP-binding protein